MKILALLASLALLAACSPEPGEESAPPQHFLYEGRFYPSFLPECRIVLQANQGVGQLKLTLAKDRETELDSAQERASERPGFPAMATDSAPLTAADVARFYASLDGVRLLEVVPDKDRPPGVDGITVYNAVSEDGQRHTFHYWSPPKNSPERRVADAVLSLARRKFTTPRQQAYFNDLARYFR